MYNKTSLGLDQVPDLVKMIAAQRNAAFGRSSGSAPLVQENARSTSRNSLGPVPIGDQHEVIERVGAAQALVGAAVGGRDLEIVIRHGGIVRPEITETDRIRPGAGRWNPVGAVEHAHDAVRASGGGAVALLLGCADAAAADDAGVAAVTKLDARGGDDEIIHLHTIVHCILQTFP